MAALTAKFPHARCPSGNRRHSECAWPYRCPAAPVILSLDSLNRYDRAHTTLRLLDRIEPS